MHQGKGESYIGWGLRVEFGDSPDIVTKSDPKTMKPHTIRDTTTWQAGGDTAKPEVSTGGRKGLSLYKLPVFRLLNQRGTHGVTGRVGMGDQHHCLPAGSCLLAYPHLMCGRSGRDQADVY